MELMTKNAAELIWLTGIVVWYVIRYPYERKARKASVRISLLDWRELTILAILWLGLFMIPVLYVASGFPAALDRSFAPVVGWLGLSTLCAALWLFHRSHVDLGRNWSATLKVRNTHALVRTGVYRFIRHPMYSSFFLLGLAQALLLSNWLADAAGLVVVVVLLACRVFREEEMMLDYFGDDYRSYMADTTRIIPWLL
jgi:protein-S-isoprenylcysteine O-methyltransferase Ste14